MSSLLLDTNVVIWLLLGDRDSVTGHAEEAMLDEDNPIFVSAVVHWEIAVKRSLGRLEIGDGWAKAIARLGFIQMPITSRHSAAVEHLPWHHRDPFDRLLIAQAQTEDQVLVSADTRIPLYDVEVLW